MNRPEPFRPNLFRRTADATDPGEYRDGRWRTFLPREPVERVLRGRTVRLRPGLTFTPYANPTACNARCAFCSEELLRIDASRLSAKRVITDDAQYFAGLDRAWQELAGVDMGLSLSGLEATSRPDWLLQLLGLLGRHPGLFQERVLYTNGSGLCTDARLIPALAAAGFDRAELSRCHFDAARNQRIMRFRRGEPIHTAAAFADTVRRMIGGGLPVRLVCIMSREGVDSVADIEAYLDQAAALGVRRVVFRALSELGDIYHENRETRWIAANRTDLRARMEEILPSGPDGAARIRDGWRLLGMTSGYYYYNEVYERGGVETVIEGSSYVAHNEAVNGAGSDGLAVMQKLVFHSSGDLCGDWVPDAQLIGNYFQL